MQRFLTAALLAMPLGAQSWLDSQKPANWNIGTLSLPTAPKLENTAMASRCAEQERPATLAADKRVRAAGWRLFGSAQVFGPLTVVQALADYDGMCRPLKFQAFVFSGGRYTGAISPKLMDSRTDGSLKNLHVFRASQVTADFARYTKEDPLCCPSSATTVIYEVGASPAGPRLIPINAASAP